MRAAVIQMRSGTDPQGNIEAASTLIRAAAKDGVTLIATPEMTGLLQRRPKKFWETVKTQDDDLCVKAFSALAAELGIYLLIGSLAIQVAEKRAVNRSFLFGPDGKLITNYDKIHLFDASLSRTETWRESAMYDAGKKLVVAGVGEHDGVKANLGFSICYDVRFSKVYRASAQAGAQIMNVPAAFTVPTGRAHWDVLLRARAIEASCYVLAPAQGGLHPDGRTTWGHSKIIDPWGDVIASLDHDEPGYICADIDLDLVEQIRRRIPAWGLVPDFEKPDPLND